MAVNVLPSKKLYLSGGSQSPTEINAPRGRRTSSGRSLCADRSEAETAGIRLGIMSASADPNPAPSLRERDLNRENYRQLAFSCTIFRYYTYRQFLLHWMLRS